MRRASRTCATAALLLASPAPAAELLLAQPSACPIGDELSFRAERALGEPLASAADVRCTIHIERSPTGVSARLSFAGMHSREAPRERSFSAASCEELTDTLALAVVIAIGSGAAEESATLGSSAIVAEPPPAAADHVEPARAAPAPGPSADGAREPLHGSLRAAIGLDVGTLPAPAIGGVVGAALSFDSLELDLSGTYLLPREASITALAGGTLRADLSYAGGSALVCLPALARAAPLAFGACLGVDVGLLWGTGKELSVSRTQRELWWAPRAELRGRWSLADGPLWLGASAAALLPIERDEFAIRDDGTPRGVHRASVVVGRLSVAAGVDLR